MLDKVSRVNPFVQMKGGPDPSPSQGQHFLPSFMYKNATKFKIYVIEKKKKNQENSTTAITLSKEEGNCKLLHVENNGK